MRRFSPLQALFLSFFSRDLYRDVARSWRGLGLLYMLLLIAVVWTPRTIAFQLKVSHFVNERAPDIVHQIPPLAIRHGHVLVSVPMPYVIKDPDSGAELAIIDTTGHTTSLDGSKARVLITANRVIIQKSAYERREFDLSQLGDFAFDQPKGMHWLGAIGTWFAGVVMLFGFVFVYLWTMVKAFVFAVLGMLMRKSARARLGYDALVRIAAVAMTPAYVAGLLRDLAHAPIPLWWCIAGLMTLGFLWFGVQASGEAVAETPVPPAA